MLLPKFKYLRPESLEEACSMLSQFNGKARVIAGGTDLMVNMKQKTDSPAYLVDISYLPGLNTIECNEEDALKIGALCTHSDIESSSLIRAKFSILAQACRSIGSVQIRNLGTIGGNLCNASPSADSAPALLGLDAKVRIFGPAGENAVELAKFFTGPGETILKPDEILSGIDISAISSSFLRCLSEVKSETGNGSICGRCCHRPVVVCRWFHLHGYPHRAGCGCTHAHSGI